MENILNLNQKNLKISLYKEIKEDKSGEKRRALLELIKSLEFVADEFEKKYKVCVNDAYEVIDGVEVIRVSNRPGLYIGYSGREKYCYTCCTECSNYRVYRLEGGKLEHIDEVFECGINYKRPEELRFFEDEDET